MNAVSLVIGLILGILLVVFGAQNAQMVSLRFFIWDTQSIPLVLALTVAMLLGALLTLLASIPGRLRNRRQRQELRQQVEAQARMTPPDPNPPERNESAS